MRVAFVWALVAIFAGCKSPSSQPSVGPPPSASAVSVTVPSPLSASASAAAPPPAASDASARLPPPIVPPLTGSACRRLAGPDAIVTAARTSVVAGGTTYSIDRIGLVERLAGDGTRRAIATARAGTRISAASFGDGHTVVAYLVDRVTSEGVLTQAFVALDDGTPTRLSEDGSGATYVELAERGTDVVAMLIDARVALTPVHARVLKLEHGKLYIGADAVLFVGGSSERHTAGALATSNRKTGFGLVPLGRDAMTFGMATIRVDDPPRDDVAVSWSMYPNGLDPAPIAATHGGEQMYFARVTPLPADAGIGKRLEVGKIADDGTVTLLGVVALSGSFRDVGIEAVAGARGVVSLTYTDASGAWTQRLACGA